eukprot:COSAG02_NODE_40797_length_401_cov_1.019868_1_plen_42_part_10
MHLEHGTHVGQEGVCGTDLTVSEKRASVIGSRVVQTNIVTCY